MVWVYKDTIIISGTLTESVAEDAYGGSVTVNTDAASQFTSWAFNMTASNGEPTGGTFTINGTSYPALEGVEYMNYQVIIGNI